VDLGSEEIKQAVCKVRLVAVQCWDAPPQHE
jgi:hypothetical protein